MKYVKRAVKKVESTYGHGYGLTCPLCIKPVTHLDIDTLLCDKCHHGMTAKQRKIWNDNVSHKIDMVQLFPESELLFNPIDVKNIFTEDTLFSLTLGLMDIEGVEHLKGSC